jgi:hypothetical protein
MDFGTGLAIIGAVSATVTIAEKAYRLTTHLLTNKKISSGDHLLKKNH